VSNLVCAHEGCEKGVETGHALYRISPTGPGQKFVGMCEEHYDGEPDPVAKTFEEDNLKHG